MVDDSLDDLRSEELSRWFLDWATRVDAVHATSKATLILAKPTSRFYFFSGAAIDLNEPTDERRWFLIN